MAVDGVLPSRTVQPKRESDESPRRDQRREDKPAPQAREEEGPMKPKPVLNPQGEVIGKTINITV